MRAGARWTDLFAVALTTWTGVHALRSFLSMIVWNIGEDRPPTQLGLIALGFWVVGLLAWPVARWVGGRRPQARFGLLFAVLYALNYFIAHPVLTPALAVAAGVVWLWLLPSVVVALGLRGTTGVLVPGILLGWAGQVAVQAALQGLDLPVLRGLHAGAVATLLAAALCASVLPLSPTPGSERFPGWSLAAVGPYLALQMTLLANPGWVATLGGWDLARSTGVIIGGLVAACAVTAWEAPPAARIGSGAAAAILLARPAWLHGSGAWLVPAVQVLLAMALAGAAGPAPSRVVIVPARHRIPGRAVYAGIAAAAVVLFALLFLFYSRYTWPQLWGVMALLAAAPALARGRGAAPGSLRAAAGAVVVGLLGLTVSVAGGAQARMGTLARPGPAPSALTVATYNIHEGFNFWGIPDPEAIARVIDSLDADLVGLQEVGRGWNVNGGPDLVAWLRWRLPQYRVVYAPMLGSLIGHVILSRYPIADSGWLPYPRRRSPLAYGLTWVVVPNVAGELLFITTHFSPYPPYGADREAQAGDLLAFWGRRPRTVVAGDFNARPGEAAVGRLRAGGLRELTVPHGLGEAYTFASGRPYERIDYIFASPDVVSLGAAIPQTTASDHLPVVARIRVR